MTGRLSSFLKNNLTTNNMKENSTQRKKEENNNKKLVSAIYCVITCNGIANNYAIDVIDFIQNYDHKFGKGVYSALRLLEKQVDESGNVMRKRVNNENTYNFLFDLANNSYKKMENDIYKFDNSINSLLRKNNVPYSDIASKIECLCTFTGYAVDIVNGIIKEFPNDKYISFSPIATFLPLRINKIDSTAKRLKGMLCTTVNDINLNKDMNCINGYAAIANKLMSSKFYKDTFRTTTYIEIGKSEKEIKDKNN